MDTDVDWSAAEALIGRLEVLREAIATLIFNGAPPPSPRLHMLALRNDEYQSAGFAYDGLFIHDVMGAPMLLLSPGGEWGTLADGIRNHELAHYVNHLYTDLALQPKWWSEGIATYAENIRYDTVTHLAELGFRPKGYEYAKYVRRIFLSDLWSWPNGDASSDMSCRYYSTTWTLVHWLLDEHRDLFDAYQHLLRAGFDARSAWSTAFHGLNEGTLAEELERYVVSVQVRDQEHAGATQLGPPAKARARRRRCARPARSTLSGDMLGQMAPWALHPKGQSPRLISQPVR